MSDREREQIAEEVIRLIGASRPGLPDDSLWTELVGSMLRADADDETSATASRLGITTARRSAEIDGLIQEFSLVRRLIDGEVGRVISAEPEQREFLLDDVHAALDRALSRAVSSYFQVRLNEARRDPVTNLPDRAAFEESLDEEIERAQRYRRQFSLLILDIDSFKSINDRLGHPEGDRILAKVGDAISRSLRRTDQVFRYGGDEFAAICLEVGEASMKTVLSRVEGALGGVGISYGVAYFPSEARDGVALVKLADERLYECKRAHHRMPP